MDAYVRFCANNVRFYVNIFVYNYDTTIPSAFSFENLKIYGRFLKRAGRGVFVNKDVLIEASFVAITAKGRIIDYR